MGLLSSDVSGEGRAVHHIRVDRIGSTGSKELWWVAVAFDDDSKKPSGMYPSYDYARALGDKLAAEHGVEVVVTHVA